MSSSFVQNRNIHKYLIMLYKRFLVYILFVVVSIPLTLSSQNFDEIDVPFFADGQSIKNPLIGGLLAPQFSKLDLDDDGFEDLMVFDRNGSVLLPFLNDGTIGEANYTYSPQYKSSFPVVRGFVQFHDFNADGRKDLFTVSSAASAIEVWRNVSTDSELIFQLMEFNFGAGNFLQIPSGAGFTNIYLSNIDIPSIIDVNGDGDLDILTFKDDGGAYMAYYENMVVEQGLGTDTLAYVIRDPCWGKFFESGVSEEISLSANPDNCASQIKGQEDIAGLRHTGSTVLALDGDGDGDLDLILGDLSNSGLVYLENSGTSADAHMTSQNTTFPDSSSEVNIYEFVGAFYIDLDNDGKRDLVAAPNNKFGPQNVDHIWMYKNIGTDAAPEFQLVTKNFPLEKSMNMGGSSSAIFLDLPLEP